MPSQEPNKPSANKPSANEGAGSSKPSTRYSIVKKGWGSRPNLQASYGLTMDPDDIAEGNAILDAFIENDRARPNAKLPKRTRPDSLSPMATLKWWEDCLGMVRTGGS
ncbi:hypothetical protein ACJ41O_005868 [Fusarium nematophilum]